MAKPKGLQLSQVQAALVQSGGNVTLAAYRLGVCEQTVRYYRKEYPQCYAAQPVPLHPVQQAILNVLRESRGAVSFYGIQARADYFIPNNTLYRHLQKLEANGKIIHIGRRGGFRIAQ
jgi:hypothetical protein